MTSAPSSGWKESGTPLPTGSRTPGPGTSGADRPGADELSPGALLARIEELTRRLEWLEASVGSAPPPTNAVPPDVVLAISAAVAAYLGKRATVRQVHLRSQRTWATQGRAQVMASHRFTHGVR